MDIQEIFKDKSNVYLNCSFTYNYPTHLIPVMSGGGQKEKIHSDKEFNEKLIEFIQNEIELKLPKETIEAILLAEGKFLNHFE